MTKYEAISQIRAGKLAIENDVEKEILLKIITVVWPKDGIPNGDRDFYSALEPNGYRWFGSDFNRLPTIKATTLAAMMEEEERSEIRSGEYEQLHELPQRKSEVQGEEEKRVKDKVQLEALLYVLKDEDLRELFIHHNKELIDELRKTLTPLLNEPSEQDKFAIGFHEFVTKFTHSMPEDKAWLNNLLELYKQSIFKIVRR